MVPKVILRATGVTFEIGPSLEIRGGAVSAQPIHRSAQGKVRWRVRGQTDNAKVVTLSKLVVLLLVSFQVDSLKPNIHGGYMKSFDSLLRNVVARAAKLPQK
jgi:hypothetical protein